MENFNTYRLLTIVFLFAMLLATEACKKADTIQTSIVGTWNGGYKYNKGQVFTQTYVFNADSTVKITQIIADSASHNILGYRYLSNGKFRLNNEQITFYQLTTLYYNDNGQGNVRYVPLAQLTPLKTDTLKTYNIKLSADYNQFYFNIVCPLNADCAPPIVFSRQ